MSRRFGLFLALTFAMFLSSCAAGSDSLAAVEPASSDAGQPSAAQPDDEGGSTEPDAAGSEQADVTESADAEEIDDAVEAEPSATSQPAVEAEPAVAAEPGEAVQPIVYRDDFGTSIAPIFATKCASCHNAGGPGSFHGNSKPPPISRQPTSGSPVR